MKSITAGILLLFSTICVAQIDTDPMLRVGYMYSAGHGGELGLFFSSIPGDSNYYNRRYYTLGAEVLSTQNEFLLTPKLSFDAHYNLIGFRFDAGYVTNFDHGYF